eukprot:scaffold59637_cov50-Phaeocystis_antarctica.AAC.3
MHWPIQGQWWSSRSTQTLHSELGYSELSTARRARVSSRTRPAWDPACSPGALFEACVAYQCAARGGRHMRHV